MKAKRYRVNESEHFNLHSMYDKLMCERIEDEENGVIDDDLTFRIAEIEELMDKAYCVGALVDWPTLRRIREIQKERQMIRYNIALASGATESDAAAAFAL